VTFSVTGRHHGPNPTGILVLSRQPAREAERFATDLVRAGMIVTIENDRTGDAITLEALRALAQTLVEDPPQSEPRRGERPFI
jgi:hypothetical protein